MKYDLIIKEEADEDVVNAFLWYEEQKEGLGDKFLLCLDEYYSVIIENPYIYEAKYNKLRQAIIKRFPYVIIYEVEENTVVIYAVFHTSRHPKIWKKRKTKT